MELSDSGALPLNEWKVSRANEGKEQQNKLDFFPKCERFHVLPHDLLGHFLSLRINPW